MEIPHKKRFQGAAIPAIIQFKNDKHRKRYMNKCPNGCRGLRIIGSIAIKANRTSIKKLSNHSHVKRVYISRRLMPQLHKAIATVGARIGHRNGWTGKGIAIAFLDSGVYKHPDLAGRIVAFKDFIHGKKRPYDDNGHGTHVIGCAAGNGASSDGRYKGSAPEANIVALKVMNREGFIDEVNVIAALQWCIDHKDKYNIRIVNLSLGMPKQLSCKDDPLCQAVEKTVRSGIIVVKSAGNFGPKVNSITSPGQSPYVITVGSINDRQRTSTGNYTIASFSSRGSNKTGRSSKPDVVAPGVSIISLRVPGSFLDKSFPHQRVRKKYFALSGTSMSAPIVSGLIAQLLQKNPNLKPSEVKKIIRSRTQHMYLPMNEQGKGKVDLRLILQLKGYGN